MFASFIPSAGKDAINYIDNKWNDPQCFKKGQDGYLNKPHHQIVYDLCSLFISK